MEMSTPRPLSDLLASTKAAFTANRISIDAILEAFHERGFGLLLFLFALPGAVPIPMPGLNTLFAIPLIILTFQQMLGFHTVWMPRRLKSATISHDHFHAIIDWALPYTERMEYLFKPRLSFMTQGIFSRLIGASGLVMAITGALPLLFVNTVPAVGVAIMGIGVMMRDGVAVIVGMVVGLLWTVCILSLYAFFGVGAVIMVKDYVLTWF